MATQAQVYPDGTVRAQLTAWSGKYTLTGLGSTNWLAQVTIPATGANEIPVIANLAQPAALAATRRTINLTIPVTPAALQAGANALIVTTDVPGDRVLLPKRNLTAPTATITYTVDARAKRMTVQWGLASAC